jgi:hypothetical protein
VLASAALNMSYVEPFKIEVYDHLVDRPEVRSMFLPLGPLSSPPTFSCPFSRSVLATDAEPQAQAIISSGAQTRPATRSSPLYSRPRLGARPVAAGCFQHEKS